MPALKANPFNYLLIPFLFMGEFFALLKLTRKIKPDLIYSHWFTPQAITASWVSKITKTPFVFTTHASDVSVWHKIPFLGRLIVVSTTKKARAITAVSKRSMAKLQSFFTAKQWQNIKHKTAIIPMGVDLASFAKPRLSQNKLKTEYGLKDKKIILFVGRLAEKKGVTYLLKAFAKIQESNPNVKLVIAGDGPLKKVLEKEALSLNINNDTIFTGYVSGQIKNDYFHLSDILVLPSIVTDDGDEEGLPVVLMEGLAAGKLCIATKESGANEVIEDRVDGFIVRQKNANDLAKKIDDILNSDKNLMLRVRAQARKTAQSFSWQKLSKDSASHLFLWKK